MNPLHQLAAISEQFSSSQVRFIHESKATSATMESDKHIQVIYVSSHRNLVMWL